MSASSAECVRPARSADDAGSTAETKKKEIASMAEDGEEYDP